MKIAGLTLTAVSLMGLHFDYQGDELIWFWRSYKGLRWYSISFEGMFVSLQAIKDLWAAYERDARVGKVKP